MLIKVNGPFVVPFFETFEEYEELKTFFFYLKISNLENFSF
jgi:hypothetical protein